MNKSLAIKKYCFDCAGESNKEATLCPIFDCPLWEHRLGSVAGSKAYHRRMDTALKNYGDELGKMEAEGIETGRFYELPSSKKRTVEKKNG